MTERRLPGQLTEEVRTKCVKVASQMAEIYEGKINFLTAYRIAIEHPDFPVMAIKDYLDKG
jgi:hypothetical protein